MNPVKLNTVGILSGGGNAGGSGMTPEQLIRSVISFKALENGLTVSLSKSPCEYCVDGDGKWKQLEPGTPSESVQKNHYLSFRTNAALSSDGLGTFSPSKQCELVGEVMGFIGAERADKNILKMGIFTKLFYNATTIIYAHQFICSETLTDGMYYSAFEGCTGLKTPPQLPATKLQRTYDGVIAEQCYYRMFYGCSSLEIAPNLPATTLSRGCYEGMLEFCINLKIAPALPASRLVMECYKNMLVGCSSLTSAVIPATASEYADCQNMFFKCSNLRYLEVGLISFASGTTSDWLKNIAPEGVLVKNAAATWDNATMGVPEGWTVVTKAM